MSVPSDQLDAFIQNLQSNPQFMDQTASNMAVHMDPPSGQYDFAQATPTPPPTQAPAAEPPPDPARKTSEYGLDQPSAAGAGRGMGPEADPKAKKAMTDQQKLAGVKAGADLAGFGAKMAAPEPEPGQPSPGAGSAGGGKVGSFTNLPTGIPQAAKGIPQAQIAPPTLPAGPSAMVPPQMAMQKQQLPPSLMDISQGYGQ